MKKMNMAAEAAIKELVNSTAIEEIVVHGGIFHADDALCVAMARETNQNVRVTRAFKAQGPADGVLVADIGLGRYDHHQPDARRRADSGEKYAACGLMLEVVWPAIFPDEKSYREFERDFIVPIELADNGVCTNPLSLAVSSFVPEWDSEESMDAAFLKAVDMLQGILQREVARADSRLRAENGVREALTDSDDGKVVILPRFMPWQAVLVPSAALFAVFPSNRGGYNLQVVPVAEGSFEAKLPLPEGWLSEKPEGCTFVHPGRFLASFGTEAEAVAAARLAMAEA